MIKNLIYINLLENLINIIFIITIKISKMSELIKNEMIF
jgi:hypothetical protein